MQEKVQQKGNLGADVIMFSGCKDSQTSADANLQGQGQVITLSLLGRLDHQVQQQSNMTLIEIGSHELCRYQSTGHVSWYQLRESLDVY